MNQIKDELQVLDIEFNQQLNEVEICMKEEIKNINFMR